jgi:class 3 adenylate cyclase
LPSIRPGEVGRWSNPTCAKSPVGGLDARVDGGAVLRETAGVSPEIRYAKSGDVHIAYQVVGEGPFDLVIVPAFVSNIELDWELPQKAGFYERLASFSRLILFDKRGAGLSDRVVGHPSLEARMDDIRVVLDAVGSERAALMGFSEGGPISILFAATYPERSMALVLYATMATFVRTADHPWNPTVEESLAGSEIVAKRWAETEFHRESIRHIAPRLAEDDEFIERWARLARQSISPSTALALVRLNLEIDVRSVLPSVRVPTLVMFGGGHVGASRFLAERIPGARYVEEPDRTHVIWLDPEPVLAEIEEFLNGVWGERAWEETGHDRVLTTVLFTDIVESTAQAVALTDSGWRELLERHHALVRRQLVRFRGQEIDVAGDGFFARFDGPARAIRCACAIAEAAPALGVEIRAGIHTGECELVDGRTVGIAVHIGARFAAEAHPSEVLVSHTVKDLVAGSGIEFEDRGESVLKGVPGEWRLFAVERESVR